MKRFVASMFFCVMALFLVEPVFSEQPARDTAQVFAAIKGKVGAGIICDNQGHMFVGKNGELLVITPKGDGGSPSSKAADKKPLVQFHSPFAGDGIDASFGLGLGQNQVGSLAYTVRGMVGLASVDVGGFTLGVNGGAQCTFSGPNTQTLESSQYSAISPYDNSTLTLQRDVTKANSGAFSIEPLELYVRTPAVNVWGAAVSLETGVGAGYGWSSGSTTTSELSSQSPYMDKWGTTHAAPYLLQSQTLDQQSGNGFVWTPHVELDVGTSVGKFGLRYDQHISSSPNLAGWSLGLSYGISFK